MGCGASKETPVQETFPIQDEHRNDFDYHYVSWATTMNVEHTHMCHPLNVEELLKAVNWALDNGKRVRLVGHKHNWSPITLSPQDDAQVKEVVLIMLDKVDNGFSVNEKDEDNAGKPTATVSPGLPQIDFLTLLEQAPRTIGNDNAAPGFGITHCPAPDLITMGGVTAINGHGTAVSCEREREVYGDDRTYGSWSNRVVKMKVVVFDAESGKYVEKELKRNEDGGKPISPFLTSIGRSLITSATYQVEPNYYMRCRSFMGIDWQTMFAAPNADGSPAPRSMAWFMERHGRAEAIWYPFTTCPWLKVWTVTDDKCPKNSREVVHSCNYPFSDELPGFITGLIDFMTGAWGEHAPRVFINEDINADDKDEQEDGEAARHEIGKRADTAAGVTDDDDDDTKKQKRIAHAKTQLESTEKGKKLLSDVKTLDAKRKEAQEAAAAAADDDDDIPEYEKEEGKPLAGANTDFPPLEDLFWDAIGLAKWGGLTPIFGNAIYEVTLAGLRNEKAADIWGPSKNTLIYVRDTTVKVSANGYAIVCNRGHVAQVMHKFTHLFNDMLEEYQKTKLINAYPITMPLEIRVTGLDDPVPIGDGKSVSPPLSALYVSDDDKAAGFDCCLWLDVLSLPGNFGANKFYADMETRLLNDEDFNGPKAKLRPEWSKGWGYSAENGPWAEARMLKHTRASLPGWNEAIAGLDAADAKALYTNAWMKNFFTKVDASGEGVSS